MGGQGARHHHQAGGAFIQPVDDTRARQPAKGGIVMQQRIQQGTRGIARGRVHHQPGRLVNDQQVGVLVDDIQPDRLGLIARLPGDLGIDTDALPPLHGFTHARHTRIHRYLPGTDPLLQPAA